LVLYSGVVRLLAQERQKSAFLGYFFPQVVRQGQ